MTAAAPPRPGPSPNAPPPPPTRPPKGRNLLANRAVGTVLRSRWYPGVLQIPVAAVFGLVAYQLLVGPDNAHDNAGTALMWVLWWPLIPIVFVFLGRFWCAVCPFGLISDVVQSFVGLHRPVPRFLKRYGIWIIDASFLAITWSDHVWGIVESPWGSGVLLLLLTTAVIISGALFQRRTFCRYLCFLGGLAGNYARTGMVALRADADICATCTSKAACFNGTATAPGCPMFSFPRQLDSNANCTLCGSCVKACPNDALTITVRKPTQELWFIRAPKLEESALATAIMGIVSGHRGRSPGDIADSPVKPTTRSCAPSTGSRSPIRTCWRAAKSRSRAISSSAPGARPLESFHGPPGRPGVAPTSATAARCPCRSKIA
jgi:ferredoxin